MRMRRWGAPVITLVIVIGIAGCAKVTGGSPGSGGIEHPTGPTQLILRVETGGGFVTPQYTLSQTAGFSLFGDGTVVTTGPQIEIYPGPALPNLLARSIDETGIQTILEAARDAGLRGPDRTYEEPMVADAGETTFTVVANGDRHVTTVEALGMSDPETGARAKLYAFSQKLGDLERWLPPGTLGEERPFEFQALRVYVMPTFPEGGEELSQPEKRWPLAEPLSSFGDPVQGQSDIRCGAVAGVDVDELRPLAKNANELTPWRSEDDVYHLVFRPMLPDESGC